MPGTRDVASRVQKRLRKCYERKADALGPCSDATAGVYRFY